MALPEIRVRTKIPAEAVEERMGKLLTYDDHAFAINPNRACKVRKPDGTLLCVYLPGAVTDDIDAVYPILAAAAATGTTENRGTASGTAEMVIQNQQRRGKPVSSALVGAFEASGFYKYCRLATWTSKEMDGQWPELFPFFQRCASLFKEHVPDRYEAQMKHVRRTPQEWCVPGTPYTTVTLNDTWPTAAHTDKGDLDEGFSCLAVARRGNFTGGWLTFPEYEIAVDLPHGSLILMNAHDVHGNAGAMVCECGTELGHSEGHRGTGPCKKCGAQRISCVMYFRTKMTSCGTSEEEQAKAQDRAERVNTKEAEVEVPPALLDDAPPLLFG